MSSVIDKNGSCIIDTSPGDMDTNQSKVSDNLLPGDIHVEQASNTKL